MPWDIQKKDGKYCVIKQGTNESSGCHDTRSDAANQLRALYANEANMAVEEILSELDDEEFISEFTFSDNMQEFPWEGPIVFENVTTGDNRVFKPNSINWEPETLPWAFRWQKASGQGHAGSVPVGRVDGIKRMEDGSIHGFGVVIPELSTEADEYFKILKSGVGGGVSVDGDSAQFDIQEKEGSQPRVEFSAMRLRALSAVDIPAFNGARIHLVGSETEAAQNTSLEVETVTDLREELAKKKALKKKTSYGWSIDESLTAAAIPVLPSTNAFLDPKFDGPTALTVTPDGRVFGHLALFNTCHIGFPGTCVKPPKGSSYQYFHTGQIETVEGDLVDCGKLTFKIGHADMKASPRVAAEHYDNTNAVAADVRAGEDKFGIWVVGALRPHLSDEDIRAFRAAPLSGDWRRIAGKLELVGALGVNTPGFPVPRVRALVASGETETLFTFLEDDDEEFHPSNYELNLRLDKKLGLSSKVNTIAGEELVVEAPVVEAPVVEAPVDEIKEYEMNLRLDKKVDLSAKVDKFFSPPPSDTAPPGIIKEDVPSAPSKKEIEARAANYTKNQFFNDLKAMRELLDDPGATMSAKVRKALEELYSAGIKTDSSGKRTTYSGLDLDIIENSGLEIEEWETQLELSGLDVHEFYNQCHDNNGKFCPGKDGPGRARDNVKGKHFIPGEPHGKDHPGHSGGGGGGGTSPPTGGGGSTPSTKPGFVTCGPGEYYDKASGGCKSKSGGGGGGGGTTSSSGTSYSGGGGVNHKLYENHVITRKRATGWAAAATIAALALNSPATPLLAGLAKAAGVAVIANPAVLALALVTGVSFAAKNVIVSRKHRAEYNRQVQRKLALDKLNERQRRERERLTVST